MSDFVNQCDQSYPCLKVSKTKDPPLILRKKPVQLQPQLTLNANGTVESVDHCQYLGTILDSKFKFAVTL